MNDPFPFYYVGGGYYRRKGIQKGETAETLHGEQVADYIRQYLVLKTDEHPLREKPETPKE